MRLLLDTHVYLWWLNDDPRLSPRARESVGDPTSIVHVSAVSAWEAAVKAAAGRVVLGPVDLIGAIQSNAFIELPITARHAEHAAHLPRLHGDPFDRMLIAQAQIEDLVLLTYDRNVRAYDVATLS